jgi:hypothetical protein
MVTCIFALLSSDERTNDIVCAFINDGIPLTSISVLIPKITRGARAPAGPGFAAASDATGSRTTGEILDGDLGWLVGIDMAKVVDDSPFLVVGPLLAGVDGTAVEAAGGSIAGALIGLGMPVSVARRFDGRIRDGSILLAIQVNDGTGIGHVRRILAEQDADEVCYAGAVRSVQGGPAAGLAATSNSARLRSTLRPRFGNAVESRVQSVLSMMREGISSTSW